MVHRILLGDKAEEMSIKLFKDGQLFSELPPFSLAPFFVNCVRIFSKLEVNTPEEQAKFDSMLQEVGTGFGNVAVRHDVGAFLGVIGHPVNAG
jgi:hypothetical protein